MTPALPTYSAYKDIGEPWVGEVPSHWGVERGKWLFVKGQRPARSEDETVTCFRDGVVTLRRNRRLRGFTEALKEIGYQGVRSGDLVIHAMDAFAGAIGVSDSDGKCSPVYQVCLPRTNVNARYYAFLIREMSRSLWIMALAKGIRERSTDFRFETFGNQFLPVPPPDEQAAIVRYLGTVDRQVSRFVRAKRRLIEVLTEQKRAMIAHAVTRGLEPNARLKPSGTDWLGDLPEHWKVLALKRVLRRLIDCEHKTAPASEAGATEEYRVVRTTAVRNGRLRLSGTYCTTADAFAQWTERGLPEPGDVIFTREAPAGEACVVPPEHRVCLGQRTVLMKLRRDRYDSAFLVHMIYAGPPSHRIRIASQGSTVGHFNMDDIADMQVYMPPLSDQEAIVAWIAENTKDLDLASVQAEREIDLIREYRTRLVADVVSGKLDVRAAAASLHDDSLADSDSLLDDEDVESDGEETDSQPIEEEADVVQ